MKGKIIVAGAGISGLAAAERLQRNGFETVVLEARERIGGRIHTSYDFKTPVDLGASWIHYPEGNPLERFINLLGLKVKTTKYFNADFHDSSGNAIARNQIFRTLLRYARARDKASEFSRTSARDESVIAGLARYSSSEDFEDPLFGHLIKVFESELGADFNDASLFGYFHEGDKFEGDDLLITNGYNKITNHLARQLDIYLDCPVSGFVQTRESVIVETSKEKFEADGVILTVPVGILQENKIAFDPPLPDYKQDAIRQIRMGVLDKVILEFAEPFWSSSCHFFNFLSDKHPKYSIVANMKYFTNAPLLVAFSGGRSDGKLIEEQEDADIKKYWETTLQQAFPRQNKEITKMEVTRWLSDPFSRGSYSYLPLGGNGTHIDALAEPFKKILFAGEATFRPYYSYIHGAYLSGLREADRIIAGF